MTNKMPDRNLDYNQISKDMTEWLQNKANDA
jgi:hypothetical protein